jgi:isopenicillin N synthase-like dioxygenase
VDRILECFAVGLGLPEDHFKQMTNVRDCNNHTFLQYHKYPSVESLKWKPGTNRITPHTDETLITLLLPDPNSVGLELAAGSDGRAVIGSADGLYTVESWTPCPPLPGCITVNIGDPLQFISDGLLRSNYHRVRMPRADEPKGDRYSMGYFVWPRDQDVLQGPKQLYPKQTMAEFMRVKGKMYGNAFHPDPQVYEAQQHLAFGPPVVERPFQQVQVQG